MSENNNDLTKSLARLQEEAAKRASSGASITPTITPGLPQSSESPVPVTIRPSFADNKKSSDRPLIFNAKSRDNVKSTNKVDNVLENDRAYAEVLWHWIKSNHFLSSLQSSQKKAKYIVDSAKYKSDPDPITLKEGSIFSEPKVDISFNNGRLCLKALPNHNVFNENSAVSLINCARVIANKELDMHLEKNKELIDNALKQKFGDNYKNELPTEKIEQEKINCLDPKIIQQIFSFNIVNCVSARDLAIMLQEMSQKTPKLYATLAPHVKEIAERALDNDAFDKSYKDILRKTLQQQSPSDETRQPKPKS